jgi:hypothetical protein
MAKLNFLSESNGQLLRKDSTPWKVCYVGCRNLIASWIRLAWWIFSCGIWRRVVYYCAPQTFLIQLNWTELLYYDRRSVGQCVFVSSPLLGLMTRFFNIVRQLRVCWNGAPSLTRGRVCLLQLLLSSPAQSFSGPSPAGLMTIFHCLRFENPSTWRTRSLYPPGTGWPSYTPRHWVVSHSLLLI